VKRVPATGSPALVHDPHSVWEATEPWTKLFDLLGGDPPNRVLRCEDEA